MSSLSSSSSSSTLTSRARRAAHHHHRHRPFLNNKRPRRGCVYELAQFLCHDKKQVVVITGAGVSVASGVPPFRSQGGVWSNVVWETNTRAAFRKNPLVWYRDFWIPLFGAGGDKKKYTPNDAHMALEQLMNMCPSSMTLITQNIDGLHDTASSEDDSNHNTVIEAHGRLGYYKCIPPEDSDTDSDDDEDDERLVHLGHRRKSRALRRAAAASSSGDGNVTTSSSSLSSSIRVPCRYEFMDSIPLELVQPSTCRDALEGKTTTRLTTIPRCPLCNSPIAPQVLLFDEGYHSHSHYEFERMENALSQCEILIFVGTSFHVRLSQIALQHARENTLRVYNFNTVDVLEPTARLNVCNVVGPCEETLPRLVEACLEIQRETNKQQQQASVNN